MKNTMKIVIAIVAIAIILGAVAAYIFTQPSENTVMLTASGATFPQPFLNATIVQYSSIKSNVEINYQGVGSGAGINGLTTKQTDFAASDAPLNSNQTSYLPSAVLHIPETIGAVTLAYNLPGVSTGLNLTGDVIAKIYLGTINNWNDPAIAALNPTTTLPDHAITTVHRSDSSGTTNIFTTYLSNENSAWSSGPSHGTSVQWPGTNAVGAKGNSLVASTVSTTTYAIGYVELAYALQNHMTVASVENPTGNFIAPSLASTTTAVAAGATGLPSGDQSWSSVSLLNAPDAQAYPIVSFTYILVYKDLHTVPDMTLDKANAVVQYLWYVIHDGQSLGPALQYAALPANVVAIDEASLRSITFNGQALTVE